MKPQDSPKDAAVKRRSARLQAQQQSIEPSPVKPPSVELPPVEPPPVEPPPVEPPPVEPSPVEPPLQVIYPVVSAVKPSPRFVSPPQITSSVAPAVTPPRFVSPSQVTSPVASSVDSPPSSVIFPVKPSLVKLLQQQLEGLENVNIQPYIGVTDLFKAVELHSQDQQQYLAFRPVTKDDLAQIENARYEFGRRFRITFYSDTNLLILKMPIAKHEIAHLGLGAKFLFKLAGMGMSDDMITCCGATTYNSSTSSKESDSAYRPLSRTDANWPTFVIESGYSENLQHLRSCASWWLGNSQGEVKFAIIISVQQVQKILHIEKWELALPSQERPATRRALSLIPTKVQEITIRPDNTISGSLPLVLRFQDIFLRPAIFPEGDITFAVEDLSKWADKVWGRDSGN